MHRTLPITMVLLLSAGVAVAQWHDTFDSYAAGSPLVPQGGWEVWYSGGGDGYVSNAQAASPPNSLIEVAANDMVYRFTISSGKWMYKVKTYIPTGASGAGYAILMNQYGDSATDSWSMQVRFDGDNEVVASEFEELGLPLIRDQWVELRANIDLDADTLDIYYDGQPLSTGLVWSTHMDTAGIKAIACTDLFSNTMDNYYYDDVALSPVIRGDVDCDGLVNTFDIDPFVLAIVNPEVYAQQFWYCDIMNADVDQDGLVNTFDIDPFVECIIQHGCP
jgi:hypothetical protein